MVGFDLLSFDTQSQLHNLCHSLYAKSSVSVLCWQIVSCGPTNTILRSLDPSQEEFHDFVP